MASTLHLKNPRSSASAALAARDWASLPPDILISVFLMLGPAEIKRGAERACAVWRRVAVDDPALWRCIDMGKGGLAVFLRRTGGGASHHGSRRRGVRSLLGALRQPLALLYGSMVQYTLSEIRPIFEIKW